ncbi:MAG: molybdopterin-binding protein [Thermomicrobiales bacterium]
MRAHIISIGSELLLGHITDTNATFLAQELTAVGIPLVHVTSAGDDRGELEGAIRHALSLTNLVICSGGIGPTDDDLTREVIADIAGETPTLDPDLFDTLRSFFANRGQNMPERNAKQAWTIPSCEVLPNPVGTAPGWMVRPTTHPGSIIIAMPGVPREMYKMWQEQALPRIIKESGDNIIDTMTIKTIGIGESAAEQELHDLVLKADPTVATYAKDDGVHVVVTATGDVPAEVRARRDGAVTEINRRFGSMVWGVDTQTWATVLAGLLARDNRKLGVIEHGTGGAFTEILARDLNGTAALAESRVLPLSLAPLGEDVGAFAADLAQQAAALPGASVGHALVLEGERQPDGLFSGRVWVSMAVAGSPSVTIDPANQRSSLAEVQRRSALHAVDCLRKFLDQS